MVKKSKKIKEEPVEEGVRRITLGEFGVTDTSAPPPEMGGIKKVCSQSSKTYLKTNFDLSLGVIVSMDVCIY